MAEKKQSGFRRKEEDFSELEENKYVKKWIECYAEKQKRPRLSILNNFCEFTKKNPTELIMEHSEDIRQEDPINIKGEVKKQLKEFFKFLLNEKMISWNASVQYVYSKLTGFWSKNNVPIIFSKGERPIMRQEGKKDKVMRMVKTDKKTGEIELDEETGEVKLIVVKEKKEIFKNIRDSFKNVRDKAILLCKISTGIDDVDLFNLKIKDFKNGYFENLQVCYIKGYRQKPLGNPIYQAILNIEACKLLDIYLVERKQVNNSNNLDPNDYLFVSNKHPSNRIGSGAFAGNLKTVCNTLKIKSVTPKYIRNWFQTCALKEGINKQIVKRMMGHKGDIDEVYQQIFNNPEEFVEEYADKINEITSLGNGNKKMVRFEDKLSKFEKIMANKDVQMNDMREELEKKIIEKDIEMASMKEDLSFLLDAVKKYSKYVDKYPPEMTIDIAPANSLKICKTCGNEFKPKTYNQIYCKKSCSGKNNKNK